MSETKSENSLNGLVEPINVAKYGFTIVQIETKSTCNMKCEFCPYPIREDKGQEMSDEVVYSIIDSIVPDESFEYVCFSQFNEPLMDNRIYDFIAYAKKRGLPVLVISNGLLFKSQDKINRLVQAGPDFVKISLQTINDKMFKHARGVNSSFESYKQWIYNYLEAVAGTNTQVSVDVACNFLSWKRSLKTGIFGLDRGDASVYPSVNSLKDDLEVFLKEWESKYSEFQFDKSHYKKFLKDLESFYIGQEGFPIAENIAVKVKPFKYGRSIRDYHPISISSGCGTREVGILASGNVVPCCLSYGKHLNMGNVNTMSFAKALHKSARLISCIRTGDNFPKTCSKCLGAPTKRGAFFKSLKNQWERSKKANKH